MQKFLESSQYINWQHPAVVNKATELALNCSSDEEIANKCFQFVRDGIKHSLDYQLNPVTCKASDVLIYKTGYCYAKSHLLAALLRANGIPAGLCYQRLALEADGTPYCLHGLNAVFLKEYGWYRLDARGNKPNVIAEFCPPIERLAFPIVAAGEKDLPEIYAEPLAAVIIALTENETVEQVYQNLPDIG